jgi:alpha-amylase
MNEVLLQGFHYFLEPPFAQMNGQRLWVFLTNEADHLRSIGIDAIWIPPAYRGADVNGPGYDVYDHYNVGEFELNGKTETRYGTRAELQSAIAALHGNGNVKRINVYADVVLNHIDGGQPDGYWEAIRVEKFDRTIVRDGEGFERGVIEIKAWTCFDYPERAGKHSAFTWRAKHFDSVDTVIDIRQDGRSFTDTNKYIYRFLFNEPGFVPREKNFERWVDLEKGNYDYLNSCDFDYGRTDVREEMKSWGAWYFQQFDFDGIRFDAVKHISSHYIQQWLGHVRWKTGKDLFAVGEYIAFNTGKLHDYIEDISTKWEYPQRITLFDFPLFFKFQTASWAGEHYDLGLLFVNTLMAEAPTLAVTFVENHDYEFGRHENTHVQAWFKPLGYAFILLRESGYPCVFFPDYYGSETVKPHQGYLSGREYLDLLLQLRKQFGFGQEITYSDGNVAGWVRLGFVPGAKGAMAVVINTAHDQVRSITMHTARPNKRFYHLATIKWTPGRYQVIKQTYDRYGGKSDGLWTESDGSADFPADGGAVSIWIEDGVGLG